MKVMNEFIGRVAGDDRELFGKVSELYGSLFESYEWTKHEIEQYGDHISRNQEAYELSARDKLVTYGDEETSQYNDDEGARWIDTKKRDDHTLWLAYIDGVLDTMPTNDPNIDKLRAAYERGDVEEAKKYFDVDNANITIDFLKKHRQGTTTVYRGAVLSKRDLLNNGKDLDAMTAYDEFKKMPPNKVRDLLLKSMNNQSKRFSSFSTDPRVSMKFATPFMGVGFIGFTARLVQIPVLVAAEAEPNDINFAFTAYLGGRHKNHNWEQELNINNIKSLRNFRIVYSGDHGNIGESYAKTVHDRALSYALYRVCNGSTVKEAYDNVVPISDNSIVVSKDGCYNLLHIDASGNYKYLLSSNSYCGIPQSKLGMAIFYFLAGKNDSRAIVVSPDGKVLNKNNYAGIEPFNQRGYAIVYPADGDAWNGYQNIINLDFNELLDKPLSRRDCNLHLLDEGSDTDPVAVVDPWHLDDKTPYFIMPDGSLNYSDKAPEVLARIRAGIQEQHNRHEAAKKRIKEHRSMGRLHKLINDVSGNDHELHESLDKIYRSIFENSATDINKKQIAAQPGTCTQGIIPNGQLTDSEQMPTDETVARLMKESYKSRFGQWCGSVSPGRTSLGMLGGTGPENANADTSTAQS